ncbi:MAG: Gfo/Idh/MocA family oxidoreductase, partial [Phycisphaerae bacterium]|nr:Gfo/Idh/MocA family oxidoreductase [Phycisphaerae bacterium]
MTSRRSFLRSSGLAGSALALGPARRVLGANSDIRVAVLGVRGKGNQHITNFSKLPGVRVTAICDPDQTVLEQRRAGHDRLKLSTHADLRRVLDDRNIDAVVVATPNHWHALATIWACQAGKDVYCEKPCSHTIEEGRRMIAAARHHGRMVQVGTQRRSDAGLAEAFAEIRRGKLGPIRRTRVIHYSRRQSIGSVDGPQPVPASIDYNLWAGPAPMSPILRRQFHYDWHWFWETGDGELGNNGPHELDLCRWVAGYT